MGHRIDHFERAQEHVIEQAIKEIRSGIFPQIIGGYIITNKE